MKGRAVQQKLILVVFGTRPEAIKLFPVIHALKQQPGVRLAICATGQHGNLASDVLALAGIEPDWDLGVLQPGQSLDDLLVRLVPALGNVLDRLHPDLVVVHGDTLSAFAGAVAAHFRGIAVAHIEAGLRSGDVRQPAPEEAIRKMIAAVAAYHFAPTQAAVAALQAENVPAHMIHLTGNTGIDALLAMRARLQEDPAPIAALDAMLAPYAHLRLIGVTLHRRENQGAALDEIAKALAQVAQRGDVALIYPLHPNPHIRGVMRRHLAHLPNVALLDPLNYLHFVALLDRVSFVLTDSGGVQEEAPALGKPVLVMRATTERSEAVAAGTARLVGTQAAVIVDAVDALLADPATYAQMAQAHNPYGDGRAAPRIAQILAHG